jgi:mono/diheme cytochrome c family protein
MNLHVTFEVLLFLLRSAYSSREDKKLGEDISTPSDRVVNGGALFEQNCSSCHNFSESAISPNLSGLTCQLETDWIRKLIKNPLGLIAANDERALKLLASYKTEIPAFSSFSNLNPATILSYLHIFKSLPIEILGDTISNRIPEKIQNVGIRGELNLFAQLPASYTMPASDKMTKIEPIAGTKRMINDQRIGTYELIDQKAQHYPDLKQLRSDMVSKPGWDTGPASFAFYPELEKNGLFYTAHTEVRAIQPSYLGYTDSLKAFMQWVLTESRMDDPNAKTFKVTNREVLRIANSSQAPGMQEFAFNPNS